MIKNLEQVVLLAEHFEYHGDQAPMYDDGTPVNIQPVPGKLYRSVYNPEDNSYRLFLDYSKKIKLGLVLDGLDGESNTYTYKFKKLEPADVLDSTLNIDPSDIKAWEGWLDDEAEFVAAIAKTNVTEEEALLLDLPVELAGGLDILREDLNFINQNDVMLEAALNIGMSPTSGTLHSVSAMMSFLSHYNATQDRHALVRLLLAGIVELYKKSLDEND